MKQPKHPPGPATGATRIVGATLVIAGVIHLLPLSGALGAERLTALYGITLADPNLLLLMRHRAVLLGLLGSFLIYAAFRPHLQTVAFLLGFVTVVSFLVLAWSTGGYNRQVGRVVGADVVALVCLVLGLAVHARRSR